MASWGVQTIGSPRTLKLVFTTTGTPVRRSTARSRPVVQRIALERHRLHATGAVLVRHRRNPMP